MTENTQKSESIGERLHKARLKKKATVDQVYKETKIHPKIITALEEDRYEEFLSPIYIKAFIKTYCRFLELDANKILDDYKIVIKEEPNRVQIRAEAKPRKEKPLSMFAQLDVQKYTEAAKKWALPAAVGILGLIIGLMMITLVSKAVVKIKNMKAARPKAAQAVKQKDTTLIKALSIPQNQQLTLIIKTKGDAWVRVTSDGKVMFEGTLKKGSTEAYNANEKFQLRTGKAEFLELIANGEPLGSPGKGVMRNITVDRDGLRIEKK